VTALACLLLLAQQPQNPSPLDEHTRAHTRVQRREPRGQRWTLPAGTLFLPQRLANKSTVPLVIHFHGPAWLLEQATDRAAVLVVSPGGGSASYARVIAETPLRSLMSAAQDAARRAFSPLALSGFSAGYGAIRAVLADSGSRARVSTVILMDGLHSGYAGDRRPGPVERDALAPFLEFARLAARNRKQFLITHSEIFPGTYPGTTEAADALLQDLGLRRRAVLKWGPLGMQQLSEVRQGGFTLLGFAGNSAPDHVDHLHATRWWWRRVNLAARKEGP
jgi:hypothetical protein